LFFALVGIGWSEESREFLASTTNLNLELCKIYLEFTVEGDLQDLYPYFNTKTNSYFATFGIYNLSNTTFQTRNISMKFDTVDYNRHSKAQSENNLEYAEALESRVLSIYTSSWINQYFNYKVSTDDDGVIFFSEPSKKKEKEIADSFRFKIYLFIPENTRQYFYPLSEWRTICKTTDCVVRTDVISNIHHGFRTTSFPSTKSVYYNSPYFIIFRSSSMSKNYLVFKDFLKPNFNDNILAMIQYDEEKDNFVPYFTPTIILPFLKTLTLNKTLEFIIIDSNKSQVQLDDLSQLFISITFYTE
jgi:hypothetical protein